MAADQILIGHARNTLFTAVTSGVNTPGVDFGGFNVEKYSRFTGLATAVGSFTFRYRLGINSAAGWVVSSTFTVNSGGSAFDVLNPGGKIADFGITIANSQVFNLCVLGEPVR